MILVNKLIAIVVAVAIVLGLAHQTIADPIIITVSRMTDGTFTTSAASTTLDSGSLPPATQNNVVLSPAVIPVYNANFGTTLSNPFNGTGVTWTVTAQANVPGNPSQGVLQSGTITLHNSTTTTYFMQVKIDAGNYTLPGASGQDVLASTQFAASSVFDSTIDLSSFIDSTLIGNAVDTSPTTSPLFEIDYTRASVYRLGNIFDITLWGHPVDDPLSMTNITVTTRVTPVSEPWTMTTLLAMLIPGGLMFGFYRQRKLAVCCS